MVVLPNLCSMVTGKAESPLGVLGSSVLVFGDELQATRTEQSTPVSIPRTRARLIAVHHVLAQSGKDRLAAARDRRPPYRIEYPCGDGDAEETQDRPGDRGSRGTADDQIDDRAQQWRCEQHRRGAGHQRQPGERDAQPVGAG
jgi:hypothetical protein